MANLKKLPKKPKKSASLGTWLRYEDRVKAVQKHNRDIIAQRKRKEQIIRKYEGSVSKY